MEIILKGRPATKKNSKQVFRNPRTGKICISSSKAFTRFETDALYQIMEQKCRKNINPCHVEITFYIKGKYRVDVDNLITSIFDILQASGVIENDNQIDSVTAKKINGNEEWLTKIVIEEYKENL